MSRSCITDNSDPALMGVFANELATLDEIVPIRVTGKVSKIVGLLIECEGISVPVGSVCLIRPSFGREAVQAEVVGFRHDHALLMGLGDMHGIKQNDLVDSSSCAQTVSVSEDLLGRVVDAMGNPIDGGKAIYSNMRNRIYADCPHPMTRPRITEPIATGIRTIDALTTLGKGQRVGLFSGSGVGKSILLGMIARNTSADVNVICLVGERGREVRDFIEKDLGTEGLKRSVVVVSTSDTPALMRTKAPFTAAAIADYFRDGGADVMLFMDSVTRCANAQREIGLSAGEPPATKGYPPSVFAMLPKLLERAGRSARGSVTGIYTVLVESDDINEPIADTARSILDGHVWLSRDLANRGHYPAIEALSSISRLMIDVVTDKHREAATKIRSILATYKASEDLINIGAYVQGSSPEIDYAIKMISKINGFLRQGIQEKVSYADTVRMLTELAA
jgi:flagellum-specific ATP synthase